MNTIYKIVARFFLSVAAIAFTATASLSAPITVPAGLNPGDQYRLAFVTSVIRDATSSNIADYNAFVTASANSQTELAALGTSWMAIVSTDTVDARDNTGTNPSSTGVPIYLLDPSSTKIADNNADLWDGNLDAALGITEQGSVAGGVSFVWTGSKGFGVGDTDSEVGAFFPRIGLFDQSTNAWMAATGGIFNSTQFRFYALSDILTVAAVAEVAEPGTLGVLAVGLVGIGFARRKKQAA